MKNSSETSLKFSLITVCLNAERYLERAILSAKAQTYNNLEIIIIDGGSNDDTLNIIKKYSTDIAFWVSEPDKGIYDAMNKGVSAAKGDILYFLNSDDYLYSPQIIEKIAAAFRKNNPDILYGNLEIKIAENNKSSPSIYPGKITKGYLMRRTIAHQATFFHCRSFQKVGIFNTKYKIVADYEWLLRAIYKNKLSYFHLDDFVAVFQIGGISTDRKYEDIKMKEYTDVKKRYFSNLELFWNRIISFLLYGDLFRVILRFLLRKRLYSLLVSQKEKLLQKEFKNN